MPCDPVHPSAHSADQHTGILMHPHTSQFSSRNQTLNNQEHKDPHHQSVKRRGACPTTNPEAGFSLIEVMVVLVIIGLLSTVVLINVLPSRDKAMVEKAHTDLRMLEQAIQNYKLDNFTYPRTQDGLQALVTPPAGMTRPDRYRAEGYIRRLENDPWGNAYQYAFPGNGRAYDIYSLGADGMPGGEGQDADISVWDEL